jgi:hypothetical protein
MKTARGEAMAVFDKPVLRWKGAIDAERRRRWCLDHKHDAVRGDGIALYGRFEGNGL